MFHKTYSFIAIILLIFPANLALEESIDCDPGQWFETAIQKCSQCRGNKISIDGTTCLPCGYGLANQNKTRCECYKDGINNNNTCVKCYKNHGSSGTCHECPEGINANLDKSGCDCTKGSVWRREINICSSCRKNSIPINGTCEICGYGGMATSNFECECTTGLSVLRSDIKICTRCYQNISVSGSCKNCIHGSYVNSDQTGCVCSKGKKWNKVYNTCENCLSNEILVNDSTCKPCGYNGSPLSDSECECSGDSLSKNDKTCYKCYRNRDEVDNCSIAHCNICYTGHTTDDNRDKCFCPAGYEWSFHIGRCVACRRNTISIDGNLCESCGYKGVANPSRSDCNCKMGSLKNSNTNTCFKCYRNKVEGNIPSLKYCKSCGDNGYIKDHDRSQCKCKPLYEFNETTGECTILSRYFRYFRF